MTADGPNLSATYQCADGRDFPVEWATSEEAGKTWSWDPEHNPTPATPLDQAIWAGCGRGAGRARVECGFAEADVFIGGGSFRWINGFNYWHSIAPTDEDAARRAAASDRLREKYGTGAAFWQQWCLPRSARAVQQLRDSTGDEPVADLIDTFGYGFEQTFLMWGIDRDHPQGFMREELGQEGDRIAVELTKGYPSATLEGDQALWELAQEAKQAPSLRKLFTEATPSLEEVAAVEGGAAFVEGFQRYLDHYGWRTLDWDPSTPTIRERPQASLGMIRRTIVEDLPEPAALVAAAAEERESTITELESRFRADEAKLDEFRRRISVLPAYLGVKEGRALWQLSLGGALRHALLLKGQRLVEGGRLGSAEDIFYLLPNEIDAGNPLPMAPSPMKGEGEPDPPAASSVKGEGESEHVAAGNPLPLAPSPMKGEGESEYKAAGDPLPLTPSPMKEEGESEHVAAGDPLPLTPSPMKEEGESEYMVRVRERRAERERWLGVIPPAEIGGEKPVEPASQGQQAEIRGIAASRGVFKGRARVLTSFEQYERLSRGDVLVCVTTTPAWTPLFAVAGAIVTDGGGMLSHGAIAAREYGIPAVVGARAATRTIPDGAMVTVDGTGGVVRIEA